MIQHKGLYWPDFEGVVKMYNYMIKRVTDVDLAVGVCKSPGVCIQAGGHVGMWARRLAKYFEEVIVFEPVRELNDCLVKNTQHLPGVEVHDAALGDVNGRVTLTSLPSGRSNLHGTTKAGDPLRVYEVDCVTIDSLGLVRCDAFFLDVERHELAVLDGAQATIAAFDPVITLETLPDQQQTYEKYMRRLGYKLYRKVHNDSIFTRQK